MKNNNAVPAKLGTHFRQWVIEHFGNLDEAEIEKMITKRLENLAELREKVSRMPDRD